MNLDESLREIQKQFASTVINGTAPEKAYIESIAKIKALVVESIPEERPKHVDRDNNTYHEKIGYNQCLGEIGSIWG